MTIKHFEYGSEERAESKFLIVVPTTVKEGGGDGRNDALLSTKCLGRMNLGDEVFVDLKVVFENFDGLPTVYNKTLDEVAPTKDRHGSGFDFVIFAHDDIWFNDVLMFDKILSAGDKLDVIGACGGKTWDKNSSESGKPIIWTVASAKAGGSGFMVHAAPTNWNPNVHDMDYCDRSLFSTSYGNSPARTLTIDGSFMCFGRKAIEKLRFDEKFKFHYYDMDVSMSAYAKGLRVGTAPILLTHNSLGESVVQPSYMEMQQIFIEKWFKPKSS